jgi:hypothetical protein
MTSSGSIELAPNPIIVMGMGSSGTRLIVRILERLNVFMGGPLAANMFGEPPLFFKGPNAFTNQFRYRLPLLPSWRELVEKERAAVLRFCATELPSAYLGAGYHGGPWGFKDPRNSFTAGLYLEAFPQARFLHVIRDCIDVAETKAREDWPDLPSSRDFQYWTEVWRNVVSVCREYPARYPGCQYSELRYEDVCRFDPSAVESLATLSGKNQTQTDQAVRAIARSDRIGKVNGSVPLDPSVSALRRALGYGG